MSTSVLFVCLGNICRSPSAHAVFQAQVDAGKLDQQITVDSAGTGGWHAGEAPDRRAAAAAAERHYDLSRLRARQVGAADFLHFDYILAMDEQNLLELEALRPQDFSGHLGLFLDFHPDPPVREVPDPYYGGANGFEEVLDLIEAASRGLLNRIAR